MLETLNANGAGTNNSGSTNAEPTNNNAGSINNQLQAGTQQEKTFSQSEVNALMAKEKDQGRKAILKELGVEDVKNAKDALESYKKYLEGQKTDLQKAQDAAAEAEKGRKSLEDELNSTNQKLEVLMAGCPAEKVDDVCVLARARVNDKVPFKDAVELVKQGYPDMFNQSQQSAQNKGTGGNVNPQHKGTLPGGSGYGQRLAAKHKTTEKNPYFTN